MSSTQSETFSPRNIAVLGGLLAIALIIGEVVIGPGNDTTMAAEAADPLDGLAMRLKPVVTLDDILNGKSTSAAGGASSDMTTASAGDSASKTPEQLYQGACMACHASGVANAPKFGDAAAWSDRAAKGLDALVSSAAGGIGAMPPRGGSSLSDDEIRVVIEYMLENSK